MRNDEHPAKGLVKVRVTSGDHSIDLSIPSSLPVVELVPPIARKLHQLEPELAYAGYDLMTLDGRVLEPALSLERQRVGDGTTLTLRAVAAEPSEIAYDDIVEAVGNRVEASQLPWTPQDSARVTIGASVTLLLAGAILLVSGRQDSLFPAIVAILTCAVLIAAAGTISRILNRPTIAQALAAGASLYGGIAAFILCEPHMAMAYVVAITGGSLAAAGLLCFFAMESHREICLTPIVIGMVGAIDGLTAEVTQWNMNSILVMTFAIVSTSAGLIPWLALNNTDLRVIVPLNDLDIFGPVAPVDPENIRRQYDSGHRTALALRIAIALIAFATTPASVSMGISGVFVAALGYLGMALSVQQLYAHDEIQLTAILATIGLLETVLLTAGAYPHVTIYLAIAAALVAALAVGLTVTQSRFSLASGRIVDFLNGACLTLTVPLAVIAIGVF